METEKFDGTTVKNNVDRIFAKTGDTRKNMMEAIGYTSPLLNQAYRRGVTPDLLKKIADYLQVPESELLLNEDQIECRKMQEIDKGKVFRGSRKLQIGYCIGLLFFAYVIWTYQNSIVTAFALLLIMLFLEVMGEYKRLEKSGKKTDRAFAIAGRIVELVSFVTILVYPWIFK